MLHESVAVQVRVAENVWPTSGLVTVSRTVIVTLLLPQNFTAVGISKSQVVPHSTVRFEAHVMTGGLVFATRIS